MQSYGQSNPDERASTYTRESSLGYTPFPFGNQGYGTTYHRFAAFQNIVPPSPGYTPFYSHHHQRPDGSEFQFPERSSRSEQENLAYSHLAPFFTPSSYSVGFGGGPAGMQPGPLLTQVGSFEKRGVGVGSEGSLFNSYSLCAPVHPPPLAEDIMKVPSTLNIDSMSISSFR